MEELYRSALGVDSVNKAPGLLVLRYVQIRSPAAWVGVHLVPLLAFPIVIRLSVSALNADAVGAGLFVLLWATLVAGQTATVRGVKGWALNTALGLWLAWVVGMLVLSLLDARLHLPELLAVGVTHAACGAAVGAFQTISIAGRQRRRWIAASTTGWGFGAALTFWLYAAPWLPGLSGAFPGRIELTTLVRMLPVYALVMLAATRQPSMVRNGSLAAVR